jgi:glutamyl-tRNA synthetase
LLGELERALPYLPGGAELQQRLDETLRRKLLMAMAGLKERAKTLVELLDHSRFLWADRPLPLEAKAAALLTPEARALLGGLIAVFEAIPDWSAQTTENAVRSFADSANVKLGNVAQPLRAALTGRTTSPGIFDVLSVLGKAESIGRIRDQAAAAARAAS